MSRKAVFLSLGIGLLLLFATCLPSPEAVAQSEHPFFRNLNPHAFWQGGDLPQRVTFIDMKKGDWKVAQLTSDGKGILQFSLPSVPKICWIRSTRQSRRIRFRK